MPANRDHHGAKLARHDPIASSSRASDPIASTSSLPPTQTSPGSSTSDVKVPRPPNAFFLFRKHFCNERKAQNIYSTDGTHISKLAGEAWSALSDMERAPWFEKQEVVREKHMKKYPNYTFAPIHDPTKRKARKAMKPSRVGSQSGVAGGSKDLDEPSSSSTSQVNGHLTSSVPRRSPIRTTPLPATGELEVRSLQMNLFPLFNEM
ncbi:high mobility group box domain-containing protein [Flagelloscypha sp. PMI_526]|nr:high mobility group box domain-containing protein [Flagelloscypha sp. PMI_526]